MKKFYLLMCALVLALGTNAEVYDLTIHRDYSANYNSWNGQLSLSMNNLDHSMSINLYVKLPEGQEFFENGVKYTEFDEWSSITYDAVNYQSSPVKEGEVTWSPDEKGLVHFSGSVADTLGNTYNFHYDEKEFAPTGDTITLAGTQAMRCSYSEWDYYWSFSDQVENYYISFSLKSENNESPLGNYSKADFAEYGNSMNISHGHWSETLEYKEAEIAVIQSNDTILLNAKVLADDGNVYLIALYYADPKPLYEETITSYNLEVDTSYMQWGMLSFAATAGQYTVRLSMSTEEYEQTFDSIYGTFVQGKTMYANISVQVDESTTVYPETFSGEVTVSRNGESGAKVTGWVLCRNDTLYTLELSSSMPVKNREETLTISNAGLYLYPELGKWIIWGNTPDSARVISISVPSLEVAGTYKDTDVDIADCYIAYNLSVMGYAEEVYRIITDSIVVTYDSVAQTAKVTGVMFCKSSYKPGDYPEFTLDITAKLTHPHITYDTEDKDFEAVFDNYEIDKSPLAMYGSVLVSAENENAIAFLQFIVAEGDTALTPGSYTVSHYGGFMTLVMGNYDLQDGASASLFATLNAQGRLAELWFPYDGEIIVAEDGVITFDAINSYDRAIKVTLNPKKSEEAVENIQEDNVQSTKVIRNGQLLIQKNGKTYNAQGIEIQ